MLNLFPMKRRRFKRFLGSINLKKQNLFFVFEIFASVAKKRNLRPIFFCPSIPPKGTEHWAGSRYIVIFWANMSSVFLCCFQVKIYGSAKVKNHPIHSVMKPRLTLLFADFRCCENEKSSNHFSEAPF